MGAKKGTIPKSVENRKRWRTVALFLFGIMWKANVDNRGKLKSGPAKGKKASKRDMCIYMAEHMKEFRKVWLQTHPKKRYPSIKGFPGNNQRRRLGISFYNSLIKDNRRFKDTAVLMKAVKGSGLPIKVWDNLGKKQTTMKL
jgi:hypothetical protein